MSSIILNIHVNNMVLVCVVLIFQGVMSFSRDFYPSAAINSNIGHGIVRGIRIRCQNERSRNIIKHRNCFGEKRPPYSCLRVTVPVCINRNPVLSMILGRHPTDRLDQDDYDNDEDNFGPSPTNKNGNNNHHHISPSVVTEFETSLAIIPRLEDWDRLQRARHYARDPVFHEWPPAIRLFHPFDKSPNAAFDIAQVIEDLEIESFKVTLDSWVIVPNMEATKKEWENQQMLPDVVESGRLDSYYEQLEQESDKKIQEQIASEERKAKIKATKKFNGMSSTQQQKQQKNSSSSKSRRKKSPAEKRDEQRKMIEDGFGGPCVLCLEPNEESKEILMELRESLREGLDLDSYSSPSSLYSWEFVKNIDMGYRPLIPISKFDSFQSAMDAARRLKGLWGDPLTINVTCLEVLSCKSQDDTFNIGDTADEETLPNNQNGPQDSSPFELKREAWGRNAKIMFVGEEVDQDDKANKEMIGRLLEEGETGGGDISVDYTILDEEEESVSDLVKWLDEGDDDFDEGTQVIIGRTHFFTGDQRNYKGMPATSVVDAKDRSLGEAGAVSALARRRGVPCRKQNVWDDGEYGRRNKDFMPWGLRERKDKQKFTWIEDK